MRVLWVLSSLEGTEGTMTAAIVASALLHHGFALDVLPLNPLPPQSVPYPFPDNVEILDCPYVNRLSGVAPLTGLKGLKGYKGLFRRLYSYYDRVILDQNLDFELKAIMASGKHHVDARTTLIAHRSLSELMATRGDQALPIKQLMQRWYPQISRVITLSSHIGEELRQQFAVPSSHIIHLSLPLSAIETTTNSFLWPGGFAPKAPVVGIFGWLNVFKGVEGLLMIAKTLYDQGLFFHMVVLGDGPSRRSLEQLAQSLSLDCLFPKWPSDVLAWFRACDIIVAPQYLDGSGIDVQLAMFAGVPVLGYEGPSAVSELISAHKMGELVEMGNPMAMADKLAAWLSQPQIRERYRFPHNEVTDQLFGLPMQTKWMDALTR
ncbi:glycosyltransferase [Sulfobacillus thermosulfidooxidans]|uniref:glycosyltransferase n=1 Tax=Sulfobacillus thermosulfidooxidans TaxID=28034 RepID=UPI0006B68EED|nr:glycosyltransferase [Sulfobacillus thermosulfidooxidans]